MGQTWTAMRTMMTYSQAQNRRDAVASAKLRLGSKSCSASQCAPPSYSSTPPCGGWL